MNEIEITSKCILKGKSDHWVGSLANVYMSKEVPRFAAVFFSLLFATINNILWQCRHQRSYGCVWPLITFLKNRLSTLSFDSIVHI